MSHPDPTKTYMVRMSKCCDVTVVTASAGDESIDQCPKCHEIEPVTYLEDEDNLDEDQIWEEVI